MSKITQNQYLAILNGCADNCPASYCFFKLFLEHQHPDLRVVTQFKAIEIYKWEQSEIENRDIGLNEAGMRWCSEGWAKAFACVYEEGLSAKEIYRKTKALMGLSKLGIPNLTLQTNTLAESTTNPTNVSSQHSTGITSVIS